MRTASTSTRDRSTSVIPPIVCQLPDDVAEVEVIGTYKIRVRFYDGVEGIVDVAGLVSANDAGVFAALRDPEVFAGVHVSLGAVTWPGEIDLAPDAMYEALKRDGEWVLT